MKPVNFGKCARHMTAASVLLLATISVLAQDHDDDGIADSVDNCAVVNNPLQRDTDSDGIGNICDADLNQDCVVNVQDLGLFRAQFLTSDDDADLNGDGDVNAIDLGILRGLFFEQPGPSGQSNNCGGILLSGTTDLPFATVSALIDFGDSTFEADATVNPGGDFILPLGIFGSEGMVSLIARGSGDQSRIVLRSYAGTIGTLVAAGGDDGSVDSDDTRGLQLSALSTSLARLADALAGGPISDSATLDDAVARVDSWRLLDGAVTRQVLIDNPMVAMPADVADTVALFDDLSALQVVRLNIGFDAEPAREAALAVVLADQAEPYADGEIPETLYTLRATRETGSVAYTAALNADQTGVLSTPSAETGVSWAQLPDGSVEMIPPQPFIEFEEVIQVQDPDTGQTVFTPRQTFLRYVRVARLVRGALADHVFVTSFRESQLPEFPTEPIISTETFPSNQTAQLAYRTRSLPFSPLEIADNSLVFTYQHSDNNSEGTADPRRGLDTFDFLADGSGTTRRRGFSFTWLVDSNGELTIDFSNTETITLRRLYTVGPDMTRAIAESTLNSGETFTFSTQIIDRDESLDYEFAQTADRGYRSANVTQSSPTQFGDVFDFDLLSDGTGCRNPGSASTNWTWEIVDGRTQITRRFNFDNEIFIFRTWDPLLQIGNRVWVNETLEAFPQGPLNDPAVTPGRMNVYSVEQTFTNNQMPIPVQDNLNTPVDTPLRVYLRDIFANDFDAEADELFLRGIDNTTTLGGTIEVFSDPDSTTTAGFLYTPPPGVSDVNDTLNYSVTDRACSDELGQSMVVVIELKPPT